MAMISEPFPRLMLDRQVDAMAVCVSARRRTACLSNSHIENICMCIKSLPSSPAIRHREETLSVSGSAGSKF